MGVGGCNSRDSSTDNVFLGIRHLLLHLSSIVNENYRNPIKSGLLKIYGNEIWVGHQRKKPNKLRCRLRDKGTCNEWIVR